MNDPIKLIAAHADTCYPDYWSGSLLPHVNVPVYDNTSFEELKDLLHDELDGFVVNGPDDASPWYAAAHAAVDEMQSRTEYPFAYLDPIDEDDESEDDESEMIYAYFVFPATPMIGAGTTCLTFPSPSYFTPP